MTGGMGPYDIPRTWKPDNKAQRSSANCSAAQSGGCYCSGRCMHPELNRTTVIIDWSKVMIDSPFKELLESDVPPNGWIFPYKTKTGGTTMKINDLIDATHQNAVNKGWWEGEERSFGEIIALCHSELSEALEDYRNGHTVTETYYEGEKPCGIPVELADVLVRIFDYCGRAGIDLEHALKTKMAYNETRPIRHGGKVI